MFSQPRAYLLTWSCYGTHLHGDEGGSVDRFHNTYGETTLPIDAGRCELEDSLLAHAPFHLGALERPVVEAAIADHAAHRKWKVHAMNVRTTHVHVVVSSGNYSPDLTMDQFKGWGTRRLRTASLLGQKASAWSAGGSTRYIWDEDGLFEAINYVANRQGTTLDSNPPQFGKPRPCS